MEWYKNEGVYYSKDDRFSIIKATDRIHAGDWEMYDSLTKSYYHKPTLKECKCLAEKISSQINIVGG